MLCPMTTSLRVEPAAVAAAPVVSDVVLVAAGRRWRRVLLRTPWLAADDDLGAALGAALTAVPDGSPRPGDVVAVAEKVAVVTSGRTVDASALRAGPLAHLLARSVRPVGNSLGLSQPRKMQFVLDQAGAARVVGAALAAAVARPFGSKGTFYRLLGSTARDLDGLRGAYLDALLPPLLPGEAALLGHHLAARLGRAVAIVDVNDRGGSIRSVSAGGPDPAALLRLLADNPQGDCEQSTPVVLLRPL
jgi:F420-0:gamma-glutamyl ligase